MKRNSCAEFYSETTAKIPRMSIIRQIPPVIHYRYSIGDVVLIPSKNLFVNLNKSLKPDGDGVFYEDDSIIQMSWKDGVLNGEMFVVDKKRHSLIGIYNVVNNVVVSVFDGVNLQDGILDLSDKGDRWEGKVYCGEACGWGSLYNEKGELVYTGFRYGSRNICYGITYHYCSDIPMYDGMLHNDVRYGVGRVLARNQSVVYDGYWLNNCHLETSVVYNAQSDKHPITPMTKKLTFPSETVYLFGDVDLSWLFQLKELHVKQNSFFLSPSNSLFSLAIQQLNALEWIRIESNSFQKIKTVSISSLCVITF